MTGEKLREQENGGLTHHCAPGIQPQSAPAGAEDCLWGERKGVLGVVGAARYIHCPVGEKAMSTGKADELSWRRVSRERNFPHPCLKPLPSHSP